MKNTPLFYKSLALACALSCLSLSTFAITPEQALEKLNEAQSLRNSNPDQATEIFEQLTTDTTLINEPNIMQEALESLAFMDVSSGDYDQALSYAEQLLESNVYTALISRAAVKQAAQALGLQFVKA